MNEKSREYLRRLRDVYSEYEDNDSLLALVDLEKEDERVRELSVLREHPTVQEILRGAITRYRVCLQKLTDPAKVMTNEERATCFATMDWALFTLDSLGEDPNHATSQIDTMVLEYARKAGISTD